MERTTSESVRENRPEQSRRDSESETDERRADDDRPTLAALHRSVGNQAVKDLHEQGELQAKLAVSQPGDRSEREAERVADAVLNQEEPATERRGVDAVNRQSSGTDATVDDETESDIRSETSGGRPLSEAERSFFEPRFSRDFSDVRVHTGPQADEAARSINAEAFTLGSDVVFRSGTYDPDSQRGKKLLAHELTHVLQQDGAASRSVQRQVSMIPGGGGGGSGESGSSDGASKTNTQEQSNDDEVELWPDQPERCEFEKVDNPLERLHRELQSLAAEGKIPSNAPDKIYSDLKTANKLNDPLQQIRYLEAQGYITTDQARMMEGSILSRRAQEDMRRIMARQEQEVIVKGGKVMKRKHLDEHRFRQQLKGLETVASNFGSTVGYLTAAPFTDDRKTRVFVAKLAGALWNIGTAKIGNDYIKGHPSKPSGPSGATSPSSPTSGGQSYSGEATGSRNPGR